MRKTVQIGDIYERLTVVAEVGRDKWGQKRWECRCSCGNTITTLTHYLTSGETKSCGCFKRDKARERAYRHGMTRTPTWESWRGMLDRCSNPTHEGFKYYGGRGIDVCERWLKFENFLEDMGERPPGTTLDRIDPNKGYSPDNCQWATPTVQARNTRNAKLVTWQGETRHINEWAKLLGIHPSTLYYRVFVNQWPLERAMTEGAKK